MTNQETFNKAVKHLLAQRKMAVDAEVCVYRASNGLKCGVGCLIPDEEYRPSFEGKYSRDVQRECQSLRDINADLLEDLQHVHDSAPVDRWDEALRVVGKRFDLTYPR